MTQLTREELRRTLPNLNAADLKPLYLLHGAETYLRDRAANSIVDTALKKSSLREFNDATFSLNSSDVQEALAAAEQLPMMAERRVVRVTNFSKLREADEEVLLRYIERPSPTSIVIFIADDLDKRRRLSKTLLDKCVAVEFPSLAGTDLNSWIRSVMKELRVTADERTLAHLTELVGADARHLQTELSKLATAALPSTEITFTLVEQLTGRSRELSNFELADNLINGERKRALQTLQILFEDKAEPLMLLGLIASQYRRLSLAKDLMAGGASEQDVFRVVGLPFNKRVKFLETARRSNAERLAQGLSRIAEADLAIKTSLGGGGVVGARLQVEMLVCELMQ